jgi:hypothetical protein
MGAFSPRTLKVYREAVRRESHNNLVRQNFETPLLPCGHVLQVVISSTWGDRHYVGLCGLELYDAHGAAIVVDNKRQITASPSSINDLPNVSDDPRTVDKLLGASPKNTFAAEHMWLAPWTEGKDVRIFVTFDQPIMLSMLKIWNYSRTPTRGAKEIKVLLDDSMIFQGLARPAPHDTHTEEDVDFAQAVLFTNDASTLAVEAPNVYDHCYESNLLLFDENQQQLSTSNSTSKPKDKTSTLAAPGGGGRGAAGVGPRPTTSVTHHK